MCIRDRLRSHALEIFKGRQSSSPFRRKSSPRRPRSQPGSPIALLALGSLTFAGSPSLPVPRIPGFLGAHLGGRRLRRPSEYFYSVQEAAHAVATAGSGGE
eukprot:14722781-Alexandrium_andersonii.AAC.1